MGAIRPDSGSIQPILTVSPFCANAAPCCSARAASARTANFFGKVMALSPWSPRGPRSSSDVSAVPRRRLEGLPRTAVSRLRHGRRGQDMIAELLAQPELLQLAGGGVRQLGHDGDVVGDLPPGDLAVEEGQQLLARDR